MMLEKIREYLYEFPYLDEYSKINVDYLADKINSYSINPTTGYEPMISEDIEGNKEMQFLFSFDIQLLWNDENNNNTNNINLFEKMSEWIQTNNKNKIFPEINKINKHLVPTELKPTSCGYLYQAGSNLAVYRMQFVLLYNEFLEEE